jgi:hypothetical protein
MTTVALSNSDRLAMVDDGDFEKVAGYKWYLHSEGYAAAPDYREGIPGIVYMHKLIAEGLLVDHRDRDKLNNCRHNLRSATRAQNGGNRAKSLRKTSSQFKGVHWDTECNKWGAMLQVRIDGKRKVVRLGRHTDEVAAAKAYNTAAQHHFGEFALLNDV